MFIVMTENCLIMPVACMVTEEDYRRLLERIKARRLTDEELLRMIIENYRPSKVFAESLKSSLPLCVLSGTLAGSLLTVLTNPYNVLGYVGAVLGGFAGSIICATISMCIALKDYLEAKRKLRQLRSQ